MTDPTTTTGGEIRIFIPASVAADWDSREMATCYQGPGNAYAKVPFSGGNVELTRAELVEVRAEAAHYVNPGGPGEYLDKTERAAYRRLLKKVDDALERLDQHASTSK